MRHASRLAFCLAALIFALSSAIVGSADLPSPAGPVTDLADLLDDAQEQQLLDRIRALEKDSTAELAVATVPSLEGTTVEDYAQRLFNAWGIGQKGVNNGVLLLVAPNERHVRIEVGYGLEPILPDGLAGAIIREQLLPKFKNNDYPGGIADGVARIDDIIRVGHVLTPEERRVLDNYEHRHDWIMVPFFGLFIGIGGAAIGLGIRVKAFGAIFFGLVFSAIPFLMSLLMVPSWGPPTLGVVAVAAAVLGYRMGRRSSWRGMVRRGHESSGWVMGGSSSSGGSGSSSSSDSFSGGSSGGGGASGSW